MSRWFVLGMLLLSVTPASADGTIVFLKSRTDGNSIELRDAQGARIARFAPEDEQALLLETREWKGHYLTRWAQGAHVEVVRAFDSRLKLLEEWDSEFGTTIRPGSDSVEIRITERTQDGKLLERIHHWKPRARK